MLTGQGGFPALYLFAGAIFFICTLKIHVANLLSARLLCGMFVELNDRRRGLDPRYG
jgi:hypothetical protein